MYSPIPIENPSSLSTTIPQSIVKSVDDKPYSFETFQLLDEDPTLGLDYDLNWKENYNANNFLHQSLYENTPAEDYLQTDTSYDDGYNDFHEVNHEVKRRKCNGDTLGGVWNPPRLEVSSPFKLVPVTYIEQADSLMLEASNIILSQRSDIKQHNDLIDDLQERLCKLIRENNTLKECLEKKKYKKRIKPNTVKNGFGKQGNIAIL